ncbi:hypothetical protein SMG44B_90031 [Stenotrophomonas maltophilia]
MDAFQDENSSGWGQSPLRGNRTHPAIPLNARFCF